MTLISLRGHHLICLHFFTGEGYSSEFVENLYAILERTKNENIIITYGADNVCKRCPSLIDGVCKDEKEISEMDKTALELLKLEIKETVSWNEIRRNLPKIFNFWYRLYCIPCIYLGVCSNTYLFKSLRDISI